MNIAVLGSGAMGALFGGYLSKENNVWLVDVDEAKIGHIAENGVRIREKSGEETVFRPNAVNDTAGLPRMDLIIVFVKAMFTAKALETNKSLIGSETYVMSLQNGVGHEIKLLQFVDQGHVIIGSTQHNSSILSNGYINHGGAGRTAIGLLDGSSDRIAHIAESFTKCGLECTSSDEVKQQIWDKLFLNTSASALTAVLQVPLGFILDDRHACRLMEKLVSEAITVANAAGFSKFKEEAVIEGIKKSLDNARGGYTSIYADIKNGARTEVDTISGSIIEAAKDLGISVPYHEMLVSLIHAMENRVAYTI